MPKATPALPRQLESARRRFERWRSRKTPHSRIPDRLWAVAVKLAGEFGLHRTARTLRLDYMGLKERVDAANRHSPGEASGFLELVAPGGGGPECVVELEDPSGAKMKICLKGASIPDVATLTRIFWSGDR